MFEMKVKFYLFQGKFMELCDGGGALSKSPFFGDMAIYNVLEGRENVKKITSTRKRNEKVKQWFSFFVPWHTSREI